jgi:hypothetical protein
MTAAQVVQLAVAQCLGSNLAVRSKDISQGQASLYLEKSLVVKAGPQATCLGGVAMAMHGHGRDRRKIRG